MGTKTQKLSNIVDQIVEWQSVFTGDGSTGLTAVAGRGYFIDTTSGTVTVTLPASPKAGDVVQIADYAGTFGTNNVTLDRNGNNIQGNAANGLIETNNQSVSFVYVDDTKGWVPSLDSTVGSYGGLFVTATGGTITTSGDYKIHTFTGDGCFVVSCAGNTAGSDSVDYLVVAGGGSSGVGGGGGGGGAGGFRVSNSYGLPAPTTSPLANPTGLPVSATTYPVTVGGGGAGISLGPTATVTSGNNGSNSVFSTITSTGGGYGSGNNTETPNGSSGGPGGSGGGAYGNGSAGGSGNTPPVSPSQGNNGGLGTAPGEHTSGGGGGGAGGTGQPYNCGRNGGIGSYVSPSFAVGCAGTTGPVCGVRYFAGGGGAGNQLSGGGGGTGGSGGGGAGSPGGCAPPGIGGSGTANTGGGAGGNKHFTPSPATGGSGGKGIVIIRYKFQ